MKKLISLVLSCMIILCSIPIVSVGAEETTMPFTDSNANANVGSMSVTSTNSFGDLLSNEFEESKQLEDSATNAVLGCKIEGNIASVKVANSEDCKIVVSIYDEETNNMVASGMEEIEMYAENVLVELDEEFLPEFYLVKVFMLDKNNKPLAEAYECNDYTESYYEFLIKTVDDFEDKNVLQLDENDKSNNFGVYEDYVKIISSSDKNIYSVENSTDNTYVFTNVNEDISSLQTGDIVSYTYNGEELLFKVKTIEFESGTATIEKDETLSLDEVFSYLKIISEPQNSVPARYNAKKTRNICYTEENIGGFEGITGRYCTGENTLELGLQIEMELGEYSNGEKDDDDDDDDDSNGDITIEDDDVKVEIGDAGNGSIEANAKISGGIDLTLVGSARAEIYNSKGEQVYYSADVDVTCSSYVNFSGEVNIEVPVELPPMMLGTTGAQINFEMALVLEATAEVEYRREFNNLVRVVHDKVKGDASIKNLCISSKHYEESTDGSENKNESQTKLNISGSVFLGIKLVPSISFISKEIIDVAFETKFGVEIKGQMITKKYAAHTCKACVDGDMHFLSTPAIVFTFFGLEIRITVVETETKLCDWYLSDVYGFDFTICPDLAKIEEYMNDAKTPKLPISKIKYDEGKCGDDVTYVYRYDEEVGKGTLEIKGTGPMYNQSYKFWLKYKDDIVDIKIKEGVTTLGTEAFKNCFNLENVILPNTLKDIGYYSFNDCENLRAIEIPYGVENIGEAAFAKCELLESLILPNSVKNIGGYLCSNCVSLKTIVLPNEYESFNTRYAFESCYSLKNIKLPDKLKDIGYHMFYDCINLLSIDITSSVEEIGAAAFMGCEAMTTLTIPKNVKTIGSNVCRDCEALEEVYFLDEIESFDTRSAFQNCLSLENIELPKNLKEIGYYMFNGCKSLKEIDIPNSVEKIGDGAFAKTALITLTIPASVKNIGSYLCNDCVSLEEVYFPDEVDTFDTNGAFSGCKVLKSVVFPNGVKTIDGFACSNCSNLKTAVVPEGVTTLGSYSFDGCNSLTSLTLPNSLKTISTFAFMMSFPNKEDAASFVYYYGTREEWEKIDISDLNIGLLLNPTIVFCLEQTEDNVSAQTFSVSRNLKTLNSNIETTDVYDDKDIVRTELVPNSYYVVMILRGTLENYTVDNDSLLYIDGAYSDNDGTVGFDVYYEDTDEDTIAVIFGECNHEYGEIEVIKEPSQSSEGLQGQICSKCGDITNETIIERLSSNVYIDGELVYTGVRFTFPTSDKEGFIAYTDGENYYDSEDVYVLSKDINISTVSIDKPKMLKGASMRLNEVQGLRFYTEVDIQKINELKDLGFNIKLGTLIAPVDLVGTNDLTFDIDVANYVNVVYDSSEYYTEGDFKGIVGSLANIKDKNATRNFVARGYITVENENVSKTIYADYDAGDINNNTRSIGYVANCVQKDFEFYNTLTDFHKEIVDKYANLYNQVKCDPFGFDTW